MVPIVVTFFILIFPILISFDFAFFLEKKKLFYTIKIFTIKIISGYIELINEGVVIHLTRLKAIIIPYSNILTMRSKVKPLKDYHFLKIHSRLELGEFDDLMNVIVISFILRYCSEQINWYLRCKKPYFKYDDRIIVYEEKNKLNYYLNTALVFNLLMIIISLIKIIVEKIFYAIKNRTQQN